MTPERPDPGLESTLPAGETAVDRLRVQAFTVPTDRPESDGTLQWSSTTMVAVELRAAGHTGLGYTYADASTAHLIADTLAAVVLGGDPFSAPALWEAMRVELRNQGLSGLAIMAVSAVDVALWDLAARLAGLPLVRLLGAARRRIPVYGSGGFTSYSTAEVCDQLSGWVEQGLGAVKMKVGRDPTADGERVRSARAAIGDGPALFVDANGAYDRKQALAMGERFAELGVSWFEEPVSSRDLTGLRLLRDRLPAPVEVTAGEYGFHLASFRRMLDAGAVDVLMADITRCGGVTGLLQVDALCRAHEVPLSAHCAPALSFQPCCACLAMRHIEYFHDHVRLEHLLLDGVVEPVGGALEPDLGRPGHGLELKAGGLDEWRTLAIEREDA